MERRSGAKTSKIRLLPRAYGADPTELCPSKPLNTLPSSSVPPIEDARVPSFQHHVVPSLGQPKFLRSPLLRYDSLPGGRGGLFHDSGTPINSPRSYSCRRSRRSLKQEPYFSRYRVTMKLNVPVPPESLVRVPLPVNRSSEAVPENVPLPPLPRVAVNRRLTRSPRMLPSTVPRVKYTRPSRISNTPETLLSDWLS